MGTASAAEFGLKLDCLGISHRTASPELRERAGFSAAMLREVLSAARHDTRIERLAIISTCHRTELYAETPRRTRQPAHALLTWWSEVTGVPAAELAAHSFASSGVDAARHLFRVTAGLDSVVLGEPQIVSQVASALKHSVAVHAASPLLKTAFKCAVHAGERARGLVWGRLQAASLGSAAVDAAASASNGLRDRNVVVIGAGEIAELALRSLSAHAPRSITIANRTVETAVELAGQYHAEACDLRSLPGKLQDADVVIAATRATRAFVDSEMVAAALSCRPSRALTIVDVSLPRNVDVSVRAVSGAQLIGIDDLGPYIAAAHSERRAMIPAVERLVDDELALLNVRIARRTITIGRANTTMSATVSA